MPKNKPKILIIKLSAIGDIAQSLPILHALRRKYQEAFIGWAVEDRSAPVLQGNPLINRVYVFPKKKLNAQSLSVIREIRHERFDIALDLQELLKSGIITFLSGAKRRIAHARSREFADIWLNEKLPAHNTFDPERLMVERYLEPAAYLGAPVDEVKFTLPPMPETIKDRIDTLLAGSEREIAVFSPATIWPSKHWLEQYWATLLDKLSGRFKIVFTGTQADNALIERITSQAQSGDYLNLAGQTSLLELIEVFNRAKYVIAPDTGPAHIANATQIPSIIMIFGSTGVNRTPPYGEKHHALSAYLSCQPCFRRNCPLKDTPMECMKLVTPDMVCDRIK